MRDKKVVVIGGGAGTYQVLTGLKTYSNLDISAVIAMSDSGGSTGRLRRELGILPPGDVRRAILALSDLPFARRTLQQVFDFRFSNGKGLEGHSLGNILLAALTQITGSMDKAIDEMARILNVSGSIFPVTLDKTHLVAILEDGSRVYGEANIDMRDFKLKLPIKKVYLNPKANMFSKSSKAITEADVIVMGPGDLYTSLAPVLLVEGAKEAISSSSARLIFVVNLMTKRGETDNFKASDFVDVVENHLGEAKDKLSHVIVNKQIPQAKSKISSWYKKYGSKPVIDDLKRNKNYKVVTGSFIDKTTFMRHHPQKLAKTILSVI